MASSPPPNADPHDIEIWQHCSLGQIGCPFSGERLTFFRDGIVGSDFAFDTRDLPSNLPGVGFDVASIGARFRDADVKNKVSFTAGGGAFNVINFQDRPELHLFSRDPREEYFTLALRTAVPEWHFQIATQNGLSNAPFDVAADVTIPYDQFYPAQRIIPQLTSDDFFADEQTGLPLPYVLFGGQAAAPDGHGSLKALRVVTLPECSTSQNIQDVFLAEFSNEISGQLQCQHGTDTLVGVYDVFPDLVSLTATSYLNHADVTLSDLTFSEAHPPPSNDGVIGGLLVGGQVRVHGDVERAFGFDIEPCTVTFKYDYRFSVGVDGIFSLVPTEIEMDATSGSFCNGFGILKPAGLLSILRDALSNGVPNAVHEKAKAAQVVSLSPPKDPNAADAWACEYAASPADERDDLSRCGAAFDQLTAIATTGATDLGVSNGDQTTMTSVIANPNFWRCRPPTGAEIQAQCSSGKPIRGRCEFLLPAVSVVPEADEVRIGWPNVDNFGAPSTAALMALYAQGGVPSVQSNLCSPAHEVTHAKPYYERYFPSLFLHDKACTDPTSFPPPPPLVCPCTDDSQCAFEDQCSAVGSGASSRICANACVTGADCPDSGICYSNIHLCGSSSSVVGGCTEMPSRCASWEVCKGDICVEAPQP